MNKRSKKTKDMKLFKAEKKHIADTKRPATQFLLRLLVGVKFRFNEF